MARKKKRKIAVWAIVPASVVLLAIVVVGAFGESKRARIDRLLEKMRKVTPHAPAGLTKPGILAGDGLLTKTLLFEPSRARSLGRVTDLTYGNLDGAKGKECGVAGWRGAFILDENGGVKKKILYSADRNPGVRFLDVENDGKCELYDNASWLKPAALLDHEGRLLWARIIDGKHQNEMSPGDVDGDGIPEFAIGYGGGGGIELLNIKGERIWHQDGGNVWSIEVVDTDGDGSKEIVHSHANGKMHIRDAQGKLLSTHKPPVYFSKFSICNWPGREGKPHPVAYRGDQVNVYDFEGKTIKTISVPECSHQKRGTGSGEEIVTYLRLGDKYPEVMVVVVSFSVGDRALLLLLDAKGERIYAEVLPEECEALLAVPDVDTGYEKLLVGGVDKVWEYKLKK